MTLALSVQSLESFLPHRGSAIWISDVLSADETSGSCRVVFSQGAAFANGATILESAYLEWMAQSFGYVSAAQRKLGLLPSQGDLQQAFLAAVKNFEIVEVPTKLQEGDAFVVKVKATHVVGPVTLVEGSVELEMKVLAKAQLKLFAVPNPQ